MRSIALAAGCGLAALSLPLAAQQPAPPGNTCYIEVQRLVAAPPGGIAELGSAIKALDEKLKPQVEEIAALSHRADLIEMRLREAQDTAVPSEEDGSLPVTTAEMDQLNHELQSVSEEIAAKRAQLKADYAEQMKAIVGPVQARVGERAQAFSATHGCRGLKMARNPDMAELQSAGARDITGEFVAWYGKS